MAVPLVDARPYIFCKFHTIFIMKKLFKRSSYGKLGGVCEGIANYTGIDPTVIRVAWVVASWYYGIGIVLYLALWIVAPCED